MFKGNKIFLISTNGEKKQAWYIPLLGFFGFFFFVPSFGLLIKFKGKNSTVALGLPLARFSKSKITVKNNSSVEIKTSSDIVKKLKIAIADNQKCTIGKDFFTWGAEIIFPYGKNLEVNIGDNCMFSRNILIRPSDGHTIYDINTNEILNPGKNINIGNNVWCVGNVAIFKGVNVADNCIIGHGSIVTKPCDTANALYAGVPAKMVKKDVNWRREEPDRFCELCCEDKEKIDIVYLWCDLSDENFKKKKEEAAKRYGVEFNANNDCRYIDNDELKYSLRSLEKFAPWVNNIFIVTDEQVPKWLNTEHPKIKIIDQNSILPESARPTFNSNAIEHCVVNIPGLSEHFLYANDDMFFGALIEPEFFLNKGKVACRYTKPLAKEDDSIYATSIRNARKLILSKFNKNFDFSSHHNIDMYKKSDIIACQKEFKCEIEKTINSHFRSKDNIHRIIYTDYSIFVGNGTFKRVDKKFLFMRKKDVITFFSQSRKKEEKLKKFKPKLFCINDTEETKPIDRQKSREFLDKMFPEKSRFEKTEFEK